MKALEVKNIYIRDNRKPYGVFTDSLYKNE
jgi:hypothetical protein